MPHAINKLTPNLVVSDVARSLAFYRDLLGFEVMMNVPDAPPFVFAGLQAGSVEIFLNLAETVYEEYPTFKNQPIGGTLTLFMEVTGIEAEYARLAPQVRVVMPLETKWYGMTEFAFLDPDGYVITFAQRSAPADAPPT